jgi:hypothetical protein
MFIGSVTTKTVGRVRGDIRVVMRQGVNFPPTRIAITCIAPLVGHVTWRNLDGNLQGLPPFTVTDKGPIYVPLQVPVAIAWTLNPHAHVNINWTRHTDIDINVPGFFFK